MTEPGSRIRPDCVTVAPKPYPADLGVWASWGRKAKHAYIAKPRSRATKLAVHTAGRRIMRRSISGDLAWLSTTIQRILRAAVAAIRLSTRPEAHPQA